MLVCFLLANILPLMLSQQLTTVCLSSLTVVKEADDDDDYLFVSNEANEACHFLSLSKLCFQVKTHHYTSLVPSRSAPGYYGLSDNTVWCPPPHPPPCCPAVPFTVITVWPVHRITALLPLLVNVLVGLWKKAVGVCSDRLHSLSFNHLLPVCL